MFPGKVPTKSGCLPLLDTPASPLHQDTCSLLLCTPTANGTGRCEGHRTGGNAQDWSRPDFFALANDCWIPLVSAHTCPDCLGLPWPTWMLQGAVSAWYTGHPDLDSRCDWIYLCDASDTTDTKCTGPATNFRLSRNQAGRLGQDKRRISYFSGITAMVSIGMDMGTDTMCWSRLDGVGFHSVH